MYGWPDLLFVTALYLQYRYRLQSKKIGNQDIIESIKIPTSYFCIPGGIPS